MDNVALYQQIEKIMTTTNNIDLKVRTAAVQLVNRVITLKSNVFNGCSSDRNELEAIMPRLEKCKRWAIENGEINTLRNVANNNFSEMAMHGVSFMVKYLND